MPVAIDALAVRPDARPGLLYGVYPAIVTDIKDPEQIGRVKVRLPWAPDPAGAQAEGWARIATLMAGSNRGSFFMPEVNDEVLVAFEAGDARHPYVVGGLWNGRDAPPATMDSKGQNNRKVLRSRNGITVVMDDTTGSERLILETPGGQRITLEDGPGALEIRDSNGNSVVLQTSGITVTAAASLTVSASQVTVSASVVTVNAGMTQFSGVVKADSVITNSIVSSSYTPGTGNIW
jgi:uncharacterized protein involved in type VI secretion and phage assembly